jgi:hypothetical protein
MFSIMDRNDLDLMDYRPHYEGKDRFLVGLGPVTSIRHDPNGVITLHVHWGTEQTGVATLMNFLGAHEFGSLEWGDILGLLTNVENMGTFLGGPERPISPFETNSWSTDYRRALALGRNCYWVYISPAQKALVEKEMFFTESIVSFIPKND